MYVRSQKQLPASLNSGGGGGKGAQIEVRTFGKSGWYSVRLGIGRSRFTSPLYYGAYCGLVIIFQRRICSSVAKYMLGKQKVPD